MGGEGRGKMLQSLVSQKGPELEARAVSRASVGHALFRPRFGLLQLVLDCYLESKYE
jgi:hypothetical protein